MAEPNVPRSDDAREPDGRQAEDEPTELPRRRFIANVVKGGGLAFAATLGIVRPESAEALGLGDLLDVGPGSFPIDFVDELGALLGEQIPEDGDVTSLLTDVPELADAVDLTDLLLLSGDPFYYDYLIGITDENRIRFELPRMEQGQGILTTATMIVAEELDVRVDQIDESLSPAEIRRTTGQITGGSHATASLWDPLRGVTALLRGMIVDAAARETGVPADQLRTEEGMVITPDGTSIPYNELSDGIEGRQPGGRTATPKDPSEYSIIGDSQIRLDARDIVTGEFEYTMDTNPVDNAFLAVLARPPTLGGTVQSFDASAAMAVPGVEQIFEVETGVEGTGAEGTDALGSGSGVAVVARSYGDALRARDLLDITWGPGDADDLSDDDVIDLLQTTNLPTLPISDITDLAEATESLEAEFIYPYFAHAPLETNTAIADATSTPIRIWTGAKTPLAAQAKVARNMGVSPTDVELNVMQTGGSFGRRLFFDAAVEAARISKQSGLPIKLMWTRQNDTKFGRNRPLSIHKVKATFARTDGAGNVVGALDLVDGVVGGVAGGLLGGGGDDDDDEGTPQVISFEHRASCTDLDLRHGFGDALTALTAEPQVAAFGFAQTIWHTTQVLPYDFGLTSLLLNETDTPIPTSSWRGIYSGTSVTSNEIMIDEIARALGEDELAFRQRTLTDDRSLGVLNKVAEEGEWGRDLPDGVAQGLGVHKEYKSRSAFLVEVDTRGDEPRVTRATAALDVNRVINPTGLEGQALGALTDSIAYILKTGLHLDNGAIRESAFSDFEYPRIDDIPSDIQIFFMPPNGERPGGAGELCIPSSAAAIANAWARATGIAPRRFPINEFPDGGATSA